MRQKILSSIVTREQHPLRPNTAITVHRSQGRTIPKGVIDLTKATQAGMHYVALSRFPNLSKITLVELNERHIKVEPKVQVEMERLRTTRQLKLLCKPIEEIQKPKLRIIYQNVRSLRKHFQEIPNSNEFQSADVILFCETWIGDAGPSDQNFGLENFKTSMTVQGWNDHRGLIAYSKTSIEFGTKSYIRI